MMIGTNDCKSVFKDSLSVVPGNMKKLIDEIAKNEKIQFIDTFNILLPVFKTLSADGVHLNPDGQMMIARIIQENLKYFSARR